jgi:hypothetical protein
MSLPPSACEGRALLVKVGKILDKEALDVTEDDVRANYDITVIGGRLPSYVASGKAALLGVSSLNDTIAEGSHVEKQDLIAYNDPELESILDRHSMDKAVTVAMCCLDDRERYILNRMYFSEPEATLLEVGDELDLTRERIRQIKVGAFNKMRRRHGEIMLSALGRDDNG